jgi:hypothetical protein
MMMIIIIIIIIATVILQKIVYPECPGPDLLLINDISGV